MRILMLTLLFLATGVGLGILADRHPTSRTWIDSVYQTGSIPTASPVSPIPDLDALYLPATEATGIYDPAALEDYNIKACFDGSVSAALDNRPWLRRDTVSAGLTDIQRPVQFPSLADHPGLVKMEIIHSRLGADREHCSAVRVDEHWFLTAAHCLEAEDPDRALPVYDVIAITPGVDVRGAGTRVVPIEGALCHAEHGVSRLRYPTDIALFYVEDITPFLNVQIADLEYGGLQLARADFENAYISGWGSNGGSRYLQGGPVKVSQFGESVLVSERIGDRGPNVGDSGSPLYVDFGQGPLVVGVLSQVTQDAKAIGETGIYVRAKSIRDWVERTKIICEVAGEYVC